MLTPYVPYPPSSGGQIRTFNLIKYLSKKHEITLVALYKNEKEKKYEREIKKYCKEVFLCKRPSSPWQVDNILKTIFSAYPFLIVRNTSSEAREKIKALLEKKKFDVIHAETFYVMPHLPPTTTPILLVEQTIEYKVYQHFVNTLPFFVRPFFYLDILKLRHWERFFWRKAKMVATVSKYDRNEILKLEKNLKIIIVGNAAGDEMFKIKKKIQSEKKKLFFIGNFSWLQNTEAAHFILDKIYPLLKKRKDIQFIIAGQRSYEKIGEKDMKNLKVIDLEMESAEKVEELYAEAYAFISPILGPGGTRLKLLAAMASRTPIISTPQGVEGLGLKDGYSVLVAKTPAEFVKKINLILDNPSLYRKIQNAAYSRALKFFTWKSIAHELEKVYSQIV